MLIKSQSGNELLIFENIRKIEIRYGYFDADTGEAIDVFHELPEGIKVSTSSSIVADGTYLGSYNELEARKVMNMIQNAYETSFTRTVSQQETYPVYSQIFNMPQDSEVPE